MCIHDFQVDDFHWGAVRLELVDYGLLSPDDSSHSFASGLLSLSDWVCSTPLSTHPSFIGKVANKNTQILLLM